MKNIGFIGTGVMGSGIINNLLNENYNINVYTRTKSKALPLVEKGANWLDTPKDVALNSDVIITMVGFPQDVEKVYFSEDGIFAGISANKIIVDMTTSKPSLAKKIGEAAENMNVMALDAPVSGGDLGAKNGTLSIMAGGNKEAFEKMKDIFEVIGSKYNYFGNYGTGQHTKMCNQIMVAGTMTGMTELLVYAKAANLNLEDVINTVKDGAAGNWSLTNYAPRILKQDYTPGFFAKHFLKDLRIVLDEADKMNLDLPATKLAEQLYQTLVDDKKLGNDGTQALIKLWWNE